MHGRKWCIPDITHCPLSICSYIPVIQWKYFEVVWLFVVLFFSYSMLRHKKKSDLLRSLLGLHSPIISSMKCPQAWWVSITDSLASFTRWPGLLFLLIYWPTEHLQQHWHTWNLPSATKPHWDTLPKAFPLANNKLSQKPESSFPQWESKWQIEYPQSPYFCPWIPPNFLCCSWKNFMVLQVSTHSFLPVTLCNGSEISPVIHQYSITRSHILLGRWGGRKDKENDTGKLNASPNPIPLQGAHCFKSTQSHQVQQDTRMPWAKAPSDFLISNWPYFIIARPELLTLVISAPLLSICIIVTPQLQVGEKSFPLVLHRSSQGDVHGREPSTYPGS